MVAVRPLKVFDRSAIAALMADGYTSREKYAVSRREAPETTIFEVRRLPLPEPYRKVWELTDEDFERYKQLLEDEPCFGAFDGERLVGVALSEARYWNRTLWVWEIHVLGAYRGQGIGRRLVEALRQAALRLDLRALVCEAQNTNAPAIGFYRLLGFELDGIDLSYYTNHDVESGEVAFFMKLKIGRDEKS